VKTRHKVILGGLAVLLVLIFAADYFLAESMAIAWHVRHGFHAEMQGLRFKVPLLYDEDHGVNMLELSFHTLPGHLNGKMAFITVDFHKQPPVAAGSPPQDAQLARFGHKHSEPHPLRVAGRDGTCADRVPIPIAQDAPLTARVLADTYFINCMFGDDLRIRFSGSKNAIPDFYSIMQSAEPVKGKN
jgi:hypothetical protein